MANDDPDDIKVGGGGDYGTDEPVDYLGKMGSYMEPLPDAEEEIDDVENDMSVDPADLMPPTPAMERQREEASRMEVGAYEYVTPPEGTVRVHSLVITMPQRLFDEQEKKLRALFGVITVTEDGSMVVPKDVHVLLKKAD